MKEHNTRAATLIFHNKDGSYKSVKCSSRQEGRILKEDYVEGQNVYRITDDKRAAELCKILEE